MKSVLISIQPKWCELIASGKKTVEVRKTAPKEKEPFKVYIYQTKKKWIYKLLEKLGLYQGKVIGEFVCDMVDTNFPILIPNTDIALYNDEWVFGSKAEDACLTLKEIADYGKGKPLYGWHISDLKIYDKPKELGEFRRNGEYCDSCRHLDEATNLCKKYGAYLVHNELLNWNYRCEECLEENCKITRPFQSWSYVEEL